MNVFIHVQDTNDNRPELKDFFIVFNNYAEYFSLRSLGRIPAHDADINDTLSYSIVQGNEAGLLVLDAHSGELKLSPSLNTNQLISAEMTVCVTGNALSEVSVEIKPAPL